MLTATIASTSWVRLVCHFRRWIGSSPASLVTRAMSEVRSPRRSRKIVGVTAGRQGRGERLVLVDRAGRAFAPRRGRLRLGRAGHGSLVALGERLAGDEAGGLRGLGRDPGGVRLEGQALEPRPDRSWPPSCSRFAVTAAVRAAVLTSLISTSQSRAAASASSVDLRAVVGHAEPGLGRLLLAADGSRVGDRGRGVGRA